MTRALLITNPAAARTDARAVRAILETLRGGGWTCDVQATTAPGDARRIARLARDEGIDVLVSYGGDGTAMQVAAGVVGSEIPLGIVPGGTGNLLAGNLRLPRSPVAAARLLLRGRPMPIDLGAVERDGMLQYFAVCSGAGFDALLMAATPGVAKRRWKMGAYVFRALYALPSVRSAVHRVTVDGTVHERSAAMVLIVNCGELLPPFLRLHHAIAPNDGWLDVMTLDAEGTMQSIFAFLELLRSSSRAGRRIWFTRGRHVRVETVGDARPVQLDGDVCGVTPFEARLVPGAVSILVDPARAPQPGPVVSETLLLVDDDADVLRAIGEYFHRLGYEVHRESTGGGAVTAYEEQRPDVVILDLHLPDTSGLDVLERIRANGGAVILLTGQGDIETAVRAMQLGAENFLTKPVDLPHLAAAVARVDEKVRLSRQNELLRARERLMSGAPGDGAGGGIETIGVSPKMQELGRQIELLAASERSTVLLTGESGSGKGWVARLIHQLSRRGTGGGPFVEVNCGGLSAAFLESELFGHEKGAFTDAKERRRGLFELADGGAIFLDEIGELAPELQPKLLKVLESKTFRRLGGADEIRVDVRLIAATNRDLQADVKGGRFREDLFYRLSVLPLALPPLRDRSREDRLALLMRLLASLRIELPGSPGECTAEALDRLLSAPWPGNVREMRNVLERAMILAQGAAAIGVEHLPADLRKGSGAADRRHVPQTLSEVERHHIERTLRVHGGNRTRAAQELAISRATLINKIKAYGLDI